MSIYMYILIYHPSLFAVHPVINIPGLPHFPCVPVVVVIANIYKEGLLPLAKDQDTVAVLEDRLDWEKLEWYHYN